MNSAIMPNHGSLSLPDELTKRIEALPRKEDVRLTFVDFDGTLMDDEGRFLLDPNLRNLRGEAAYEYILQKWGTFEKYVHDLDPEKHLFANFREFFDSRNSHHIILTAGNPVIQELKIDLAGFSLSPRIIVPEFDDKPEAILQYILEQGYIPGKITFIDDRVREFATVDMELASLLSIPVEFYESVPSIDARIVGIKKRTEALFDAKSPLS